MNTTTVFRVNRPKAVHLAKDVALPETVREVVILREGTRRIIVPADSVWDDFFDEGGINMPDREQPAL